MMQSTHKSLPHQLLSGLLTAICTVLLTACAMSPQTIAVQPVLKAPPMPIGHGSGVQVETRDMRGNKVIGTLGGVYKSAHLTADDNMTRAITQEAVTVLQSWDFVAVPAALGKPSMTRFEIEILDIDYQRPTTSVGGNVVVKCRVAVNVEQAGGNYRGEYRSQRSEQVAVMGTVQGNRRLINETISQALNQIFLDNKLQRFMAR